MTEHEIENPHASVNFDAAPFTRVCRPGEGGALTDEARQLLRIRAMTQEDPLAKMDEVVGAQGMPDTPWTRGCYEVLSKLATVEWAADLLETDWNESRPERPRLFWWHAV